MSTEGAVLLGAVVAFLLATWLWLVIAIARFISAGNRIVIAIPTGGFADDDGHQHNEDCFGE